MKKLTQILMIVLLILSNCKNLSAAPFDTSMITLTQPNNITFTGRIWGDEFIYWAETQDGYRFVLNTGGTGSSTFTTAANSTPYYIVVKHRNSIDTWSASGQQFSSNQMNYDFTNALSKAYGNNLKLKGGKYCIYSGDVNKDGFVNLTDLNLIYNDNIIGAQGFRSTDLTGDLLVDIDDLNIVFINKVLGISVQKPGGVLIQNSDC